MTGPRTLAADYDVYEIAYLAGGPHRAMETAVVALVESLAETVHTLSRTVEERLPPLVN